MIMNANTITKFKIGDQVFRKTGGPFETPSTIDGIIIDRRWKQPQYKLDNCSWNEDDLRSMNEQIVYFNNMVEEHQIKYFGKIP